MANVNDMFDEMKNEKSYYVEDTKNNNKKTNSFTPTVEGEYLGHIIEPETRVVEFKGYKARVYNFKVKVAPENNGINYNGKNIGGEFVGRVFRSTGVFRFLEPGEGDSFQSNPSGNKGYLNFCKALGKECNVVTQTIDGKDVEMKELPTLNTSDLTGMPVRAVVKQGKKYTNKNGYDAYYMDVKWVNEWSEGSKLEQKDGDDIPF
tara:strand:- start:580 stop:1194 length:615 start_codon:yes stop_codon:yes gene_type:complete